MKRLLTLMALVQLSCAADTGSGLIQFKAFAGGQERSENGDSYEFDTTAGYHVALTSAVMHIGAVYLNRAKPILGAQDTSCILNGTYSGEVRASVDVDALSSELVPFASLGDGTLDRALTGEVWLTGGEINAENDETRILEFAGKASKDARTYGFHGKITIGRNRAVSSSDPATPSANPPCKRRIVTPIGIDLQPTEGGHLEVRVNPCVWFDNVDFSKTDGAIGDGEETEIVDSSDDDVSSALLQGLRANDAYQFYWQK